MSPAQEEEQSLSDLPSKFQRKGIDREEERKTASSLQIESQYKSIPADDQDLEKFRKQIKKDMKMRNRIIYSHRAQQVGDFLLKKASPALAGIAGSLLLIPEPTGITKIIGASVGLAASVTGGVGLTMDYFGEKTKKHYCIKVHLKPSDLRLSEEKSLITPEKNYLKSIKKTDKLQDKIIKNEKKGKEIDDIIKKKELLEKKVSDLRGRLKSEPKLNYSNSAS
jgi:hypothetical protein